MIITFMETLKNGIVSEANLNLICTADVLVATCIQKPYEVSAQVVLRMAMGQGSSTKVHIRLCVEDDASSAEFHYDPIKRATCRCPPPLTICADSGPTLNIWAGQWYLRQNLCWPRRRAQIANFSKKFKISIFGFFAGQVPVNEIFRYGCQGVKICATFVLANGIFR